jgi:chaperonin cofactor prefoldin
MLGAHYWLTNEEREEVIDAVEDRIERLELLVNEIDDETIGEPIPVLRSALRSLRHPAETVA